MKIIVAPDTYKDSLSAQQVACAMEEGIRRVLPTAKVTCLPVADGGEGTIDVLKQTCGGTQITTEVMAANGHMRQASYLILENCALIEAAQACGIEHVPNFERNPHTATSFGVGMLIRDAVSRGVQKIIIGLGGSACNDGGAGMLQALGVQLLDSERKAIALGNEGLATLQHVDFAHLLQAYHDVEMIIAADVTNPLLGSMGATKRFARQKGAKTIKEIHQLEANMSHYCALVVQAQGHNYSGHTGSGAAGGIAFALLTLFTQVQLRRGIEVMLDLLEFDRALQGATLVITGEGKTDAQTLDGKAPLGVAQRALRAGVPTIIISGQIEGPCTLLYQEGVVAAFSMMQGLLTLPEAIACARSNIAQTTEAVIRLYVCNHKDA